MLPSQQITGCGHVTSFDYDQYGNLEALTDPNGTVKRLEYDSLHRLERESYEKPPGASDGVETPERRYAYHYGHGTSGYSYSVTSGELVENYNEPFSGGAWYGHWATTREYFDGLGRSYMSQVYPADVLRVAATDDWYFQAQGDMTITSRSVNKQGQVDYETVPYVGTEWDVTQPGTETVYDDRGRPIQATAPGGYVTTWDYDRMAIDDESFGVASSTTVVDGRAQKRFVLTDALGHQRYVTDCDDGDCAAATLPPETEPCVKYDYGRDDKLTHVRYCSDGRSTLPADQLIVRNFYDGLGRLIGKKDPNLTNCQDNSVDDPSSGCMISYAYDLAGRLGTTTDARGTSIARVYDQCGRNTTETVTTTYGESATYVNTYDVSVLGGEDYAEGQLTRSKVTMTDPFGSSEVTHEYGFDFVGRTVRHEVGVKLDSDPEATAVFGMTPGPNGAPWSTTLAHGTTSEERTFDYDSLGRPTYLSSSLHGVIYDGVSYEDDGRLGDVTLGNGMDVHWDYRVGDPSLPAGDRRLDSIYADTGSAYSQSLDYDEAGNVTQMTWDTGMVEAYTYDRLNRLSRYTRDNKIRETFTYDLLGNRETRTAYTYDGEDPIPTFGMLSGGFADGGGLTVAVPGSTTTSLGGIGGMAAGGPSVTIDTFYYHNGAAYGGEAGPQAVTCVTTDPTWSCPSANISYDYDASGNMVAKHWYGTTTTYDFNHLNKIARADWPNGEVRYAYDSVARKTATIKATGARLFFDARLEKLASGEVEFYYHLGDMRIAKATATEGASWLLSDHLGSLRAVVDALGAIVQRVGYTPFGTSSAGTDDSRYLFNDRLQDAPDVYDYGGRSYMPWLGSFMSADPVLPYGDGVLSWGRYAYVSHNPASRTDPSGYEQVNDIGNQGGYLPNTMFASKYGGVPMAYTPEYQSYPNTVIEDVDSIAGMTAHRMEKYVQALTAKIGEFLEKDELEEMLAGNEPPPDDPTIRAIFKKLYEASRERVGRKRPKQERGISVYIDRNGYVAVAVWSQSRADKRFVVFPKAHPDFGQTEGMWELAVSAHTHPFELGQPGVSYKGEHNDRKAYPLSVVRERPHWVISRENMQQMYMKNEEVAIGPLLKREEYGY